MVICRFYAHCSEGHLLSTQGRSGTVESKIRLLVKSLELVDTLSLAHPFVDGIDRISYCLTTEESHVVMSGEIPADIASRTKEEYDGKDVLRVQTTSFFIGLMVEPKDRKSCLTLELFHAVDNVG